MPKQKRPYHEDFYFREVSRMTVRLRDESDRAVALIVTSWVDDALAEMLKRRLVQDHKIIDKMFDYMGPLGTFSSRIGLAYLVGRVSKPVHDNLETIRKIRNEFAHTRDDLQFSTQSICDHCRNLYLKDFRRAEGAFPEFVPRNAFIATGIGLLGFFIEFVGAGTMSEDGKEDYFPKYMAYMEEETLDMVAEFSELEDGQGR